MEDRVYGNFATYTPPEPQRPPRPPRLQRPQVEEAFEDDINAINWFPNMFILMYEFAVNMYNPSPVSTVLEYILLILLTLLVIINISKLIGPAVMITSTILLIHCLYCYTFKETMEIFVHSLVIVGDMILAKMDHILDVVRGFF
ncbi:hypothetical protein KR009_004619 [Drosophila setifemur]|nr:hypothetical protein KR009_004619 [Drosophila setifemur]